MMIICWYCWSHCSKKLVRAGSGFISPFWKHSPVFSLYHLSAFMAMSLCWLCSNIIKPLMQFWYFIMPDVYKRQQRDFALRPVERDMILRHMFPLNLHPPRTREGVLLCLADKLCATREVVSGRLPRRSPRTG